MILLTDLIYESQFGFGKNHSTFMPLLLIQSTIYEAIDIGEVVLAWLIKSLLMLLTIRYYNPFGFI